jgi:hypothetical protein
MESRKIKISSLVGLLLILTLAQSCTYYVEEELYPIKKCSTDAMSYTNDILPILQNNGCIGCHGDLASVDLNGYHDVRIYANNGFIEGSIKHQQSFRPMPENRPKLTQCEIDKIEAWIAQGTLNN